MMKGPHSKGLIIRLIALFMLGLAIVVTGKLDAARYTYDNAVIPETSIPKLDRQTYIFLTRYGKQLQDLSYEYGVDWRLALAVLRQESSFKPEVISDKGAEGFMQLMPNTGIQLASLHNVDDFTEPIANIKLGVIHLRDMLRDFPETDGDNRLELAVASYNCGYSRIDDARTVAIFLGDNPDSWNSVRSALTLLSKRYSPLHEHIWKGGKPTGGYFAGSDETLGYVDNVMQYYNIYRNVLRR